MKRICFLVLCIVLISAGAVQALKGKTAVTAVNVREINGKKYAEVAINDRIKIKDIEVRESNGNVTLKYPVYTGKNGRVSDEVKVLSADVDRMIAESVRTGKPSGENGEFYWVITKFSPLRKESSLKAFASVEFNDCIRVECRLYKNKSGLWVAWPSRKNENTKVWTKQVILKKDIKKDIEKALINRYNTVIEEEKNEGWEEE